MSKILHQIVTTFYLLNPFYRKTFRDQILLAMKKKMGNFTAGISKNYKHSVKELVNKNQGFYFMNQVRGTPAYWKRFQYEALAMIK